MTALQGVASESALASKIGAALLSQLPTTGELERALAPPLDLTREFFVPGVFEPELLWS